MQRWKILLVNDQSFNTTHFRDALEDCADFSDCSDLANFSAHPEKPHVVVIAHQAFRKLASAGELSRLMPANPVLPFLIVTDKPEACREDTDAATYGECVTHEASADELRTVIRRLIQRTMPFGISIDLVSFKVHRNGTHSRALTPTEYRILTRCLSAGSTGVSRLALMESVWNEKRINRKLDVHLARLRTKLRPIGLTAVTNHDGHLVISDKN